MLLLWSEHIYIICPEVQQFFSLTEAGKFTTLEHGLRVIVNNFS